MREDIVRRLIEQKETLYKLMDQVDDALKGMGSEVVHRYPKCPPEESATYETRVIYSEPVKETYPCVSGTMKENGKWVLKVLKPETEKEAFEYLVFSCFSNGLNKASIRDVLIAVNTKGAHSLVSIGVTLRHATQSALDSLVDKNKLTMKQFIDDKEIYYLIRE